MVSFRWALVDIKTTGLHVTQDEIIEIAILILTPSGVEQKWHRLIKPQRILSESISSLTGITNSMVADAPTFQDIAQALSELLCSCVFVAHNARFDFGFIKNGFKRAGISYKAPVLCSIKLLKLLHPEWTNFHLAHVAKTLGFTPHTQTRPETDLDTLLHVLTDLAARHSWEKVLDKAKIIYQKSSIPSKLNTDIRQFPESSGVYLFYGDQNALPLYIGKSINLRKRILSHFSGDYTHAKEFTLAQQVSRIEIIPTAGELSALLLESELIKKQLPIYNRKLRRKSVLTGFKLTDKNHYVTISIVRERVDEEKDLRAYGLYGAFRSVLAAKRILLELTKTHDLCPKLCHLEQGIGACFSYQLKRCFGACVGEESAEAYNARVMTALEAYREKAWPYPGAIAIKESCSINQITQFSIIDQWRYLGSINDEKRLQQWKEQCVASEQPTYDAYRIISTYLNNPISQQHIIELH